MSFTLRPYQQEAVTATLDYFRQATTPAVIVLPTGAGKSLVIAELARQARGRVLVLAHVKELVEQNYSKYCTYQLTAGIFSAGLQQRQTEQKVIFGSVQSVARHLSAFNDLFSLLIIDECHRISDDSESQYQQIIQHLRQINPHLRILGLTATPYRLGKGWIYQYHHHGMIRGDETCFFRDCIYELPLRYMIRHGYLVPPNRLDMPVVHYNFAHLQPSAQGNYAVEALDQTLRAQARVTPLIVAQIRDYAQDKNGVMIFAATVEHAKEVLALLPDSESALVYADTPSDERDDIICRFKAQQLRFLVNVSVLTTGFDAPHVDVIAILRPTESITLYQQIVGRGLRLFPGKKECLILDYAGNPHDLFAPDIGQAKPASDSVPVQVFCPLCGFANLFWGKTDMDGHVIEHFGRRCQGWQLNEQQQKQQCDFRFRFKICGECGAENDIAARRCHRCECVLVDPDDMLKAALRLKDALVLRCSGMLLQPFSDSKGEGLKITYFDEDGAQISERYRLHSSAQRFFFNQHFLRVHQRDPGLPFEWQRVDEVLAQQTRLRAPDFVVGRRQGNYWQLREKIFDYQGRFRRAYELR